MPTLEQIRAARALLGWNQTDLADRAGLSQTGIARIENGTNHPNSQTLKKIEDAFDKAGIDFIGDRGVQRKDNTFIKLKGQDGFKEFIDDVYDTLKAHGDDFCVFNAAPKEWIQASGQELWLMHKDRMSTIKDKITGRIILEKGNTDFVDVDYVEYRWFANEIYDTKRTFYSYYDRIAFIDLTSDSFEIIIMKRMEFAQGFRTLFNEVWEKSTEPVKA